MYAVHKICAEFPEKFVRRKLALYNNKNVEEIIKNADRKRYGKGRLPIYIVKNNP